MLKFQIKKLDRKKKYICQVFVTSDNMVAAIEETKGIEIDC